MEGPPLQARRLSTDSPLFENEQAGRAVSLAGRRVGKTSRGRKSGRRPWHDQS
jgi:hypothetical protein